MSRGDSGRAGPAPRAKQLRGEELEARVLEVVLGEVERVGYEKLAFEQVAARAGVNKVTLYRHWPTKQELVLAALRHTVDLTLDRTDTGTLRGDLLEHFGLAGHADHPAHLLSGGQKQLLAMASVLITEPTLLVMDEPTTLLDLRNAAMIGRVVAELEPAVVLATHHLYLLESFDRVLEFEGGHLVADDAPGPAIATYRRLMEAA